MKQMSMKFFGVIIFILANHVLNAQGIINTDRPDQSDGTNIVNKEHLQLETGIAWSKLDEQTKGFDQENLFRYGVSKTFEARLLIEYAHTRDSIVTHGIKPLTIGFKNLLCQQKGLLPKLTLVSYFNLPVTISEDLPGDHFGYTLTLVTQHDLNKQCKLYSNFGISQDQETTDINFLATVEFNFNITKKLSSFIEYFGTYAPHNAAANGMDIGFIYALKNDFSVDISTGSTTMHLASDRFVAFGMSIRVPTKAGHKKQHG